MDLIAFVNNDDHLNVYRFGGQRAFGLTRKEGHGKIVSLKWKFNGKFIQAKDLTLSIAHVQNYHFHSSFE